MSGCQGIGCKHLGCRGAQARALESLGVTVFRSGHYVHWRGASRALRCARLQMALSPTMPRMHQLQCKHSRKHLGGYSSRKVYSNLGLGLGLDIEFLRNGGLWESNPLGLGLGSDLHARGAPIHEVPVEYQHVVRPWLPNDAQNLILVRVMARARARVRARARARVRVSDRPAPRARYRYR